MSKVKITPAMHRALSLMAKAHTMGLDPFTESGVRFNTVERLMDTGAIEYDKKKKDFKFNYYTAIAILGGKS